MAAFFSEMRSSFNRGNSMVRKLILINLAVFAGVNLVRLIAFFATGDRYSGDFINRWIFLPSEPLQLLYQPWSIFTYMFVHQGFFHILFNLLWLYFLGNLFQEYLGNRKLLKVYLYGGLLGAAFYLVGMNLIPVFADRSAYLQGASAGVMAVIVGIATLLPNYAIRIFVWDIKLKYIAIFMVLSSVFEMMGSNPGGNMAHLGGVVTGFLYVRSLQKRTFVDVMEENITRFFKRFSGKKKDERRIYRSKGEERVSRPDQEEVDSILDKISRSGYESLTKAERDTLFKASKADDYR